MSRLAVIFEQYEAKLRQANALDFDDLLLETVRVLTYDTELRRKYNEWIEYLMIDEYQDTLANPYVAAERGYIDRVIFPHETRPIIVRALRSLRNKRGSRLPRKHGNIPL